MSKKKNRFSFTEIVGFVAAAYRTMLPLFLGMLGIILFLALLVRFIV